MAESPTSDKLPKPIIKKNKLFQSYFDNPWDTWRFKTAGETLKWFFTVRHPPVPNEDHLKEVLPVTSPDFGENIPDNGIRITWLGHATVLFQFDGVRILCDPVFSERVSPSQAFGPKRIRPAPCKVEDLPSIDIVVISHNHYDHMDVSSIAALGAHFPSAHWFVPLGDGAWMQKTLPKGAVVKQMNWWDECKLKGITITFTPTQHWSARSLLDYNTSLWGSWAFVGPKHKVWFGGDTGYCSVFKEIGQKFNGFDMAAIPIGAYEPRDFMKHQHVNPEEAVKIHKDVQSRFSLGIHWGTFMLTKDHCTQPRDDLKDALSNASVDPQEFITLQHGCSFFKPDAPGSS